MVSGAGRGGAGRPESYCHRVMLDAVRYVVDNGVKWASLPAGFPPYRRVHAFARRWQATGLLAEFHDRLRDRVREKEGRAVDPTAAIVDSRSLRAAANIPRSTSGWDGGKKVGGRKRHVVFDCLDGPGRRGDRSGRPGPRCRRRSAHAAAHGILLDPPGAGVRRLCRAAGRLGGREPWPGPGDRPTLRRHDGAASDASSVTSTVCHRAAPPSSCAAAARRSGVRPPRTTCAPAATAW
ncbi:transposase [Streptomyces sp. NPDC005989]|uniref:transposase n=1 Tax=Streptomyces sp. NPDC005989 TaxID=3156727 RepID=UPI00340C7198